MCCYLVAKAISLVIGLTEEDVMTLPLLDHPCAAVLLVYVWMCAKGAILGAKNRIFIISDPSSRSFLVTSTLGLEEDTRRAWVDWEKGGLQTNNFFLSGGCLPRPLLLRR